MYVPGFGLGGNSFYREPTLFTSKYDFQRDIGTAAPSFAADQYYDKEKWDKDAIPDGGAAGTEFNPIELPTDTKWEWDGDTLKSITFASGVGEGNEFANRDEFLKDWCVEVSRTSEGQTVQSGEQYLYPDSVDGKKLVVAEVGAVMPDNGWYTCSPNANEWYVQDTSVTEESYIPPRDANNEYETIITAHGAGEGEAPKYYDLTEAPCKMFEAGCPDPGYRYAKLLLSMGIPVYFEQMNSDATEDLTAIVVDDDSIKKELIDEYGLGTGKIWKANPKWQTGSTEFNKYEVVKSADDILVGADKIYYVGTPIQVDAMYEGITARFAMIDPNMSKEDQKEIETPATGLEIDNMGDYTIKFFTTGGYPIFEYMNNGLAETMMEACTRRSDAIALIDHTNNPDRPIVASNTKSVSYKTRNWTLNTIAGSYASMFTPWYECSSPIVLQDYSTGTDKAHYLAMPASLAYLTTLARQIRDYNPWLAVSGVRRGQVPYLSKLHINRNLTNNIADSYQQVPQDGYTVGKGALRSINPITNIRNYGCCIWGNRTLRSNSEGTKATSFLSTRNQISDIKKCIYETSQKLLFEQNSDVLWINWKSYVTPLLDSMISNNIIRDYTITRYNIDPESGERVPAYKILAAIRIVPINAVEQFELTINIENDTTDVVSVDVSER